MDFLYAAAQPGQGGGGLAAFLPFILIMFIIYFLMIRPQTKRQKEKDMMRESLKKGDRIITRGGIVGKIIEFQGKDNQHALIDLETGSKVKILKSHVISLLENK